MNAERALAIVGPVLLLASNNVEVVDIEPDTIGVHGPLPEFAIGLNQEGDGLVFQQGEISDNENQDNADEKTLAWLLAASGLTVIAGGAWALARVGREKNRK